MKQIHAKIPHSNLTAKSEWRDRIDLLRSRVSLLAGKDKLLMTMYLKNGNTFYQMAKLVGVNEATIARRIHKVTKRLIDGEYITCLRNRDKFTSTEMSIAKDYFLMGLSIRKIAEKRHWTYYRVRETMKKIQRLVQTAEEVKNKRN
ncbi:MAG TPA: transposase family protein [Phycisphaerales bacterium]|nr:transposase family protein [Phycisphaerales bacterium]